MSGVKLIIPLVYTTVKRKLFLFFFSMVCFRIIRLKYSGQLKFFEIFSSVFISDYLCILFTPLKADACYYYPFLSSITSLFKQNVQNDVSLHVCYNPNSRGKWWVQFVYLCFLIATNPEFIVLFGCEPIIVAISRKTRRNY